MSTEKKSLRKTLKLEVLLHMVLITIAILLCTYNVKRLIERQKESKEEIAMGFKKELLQGIALLSSTEENPTVPLDKQTVKVDRLTYYTNLSERTLMSKKTNTLNILYPTLCTALKTNVRNPFLFEFKELRRIVSIALDRIIKNMNPADGFMEEGVVKKYIEAFLAGECTPEQYKKACDVFAWIIVEIHRESIELNKIISPRSASLRDTIVTEIIKPTLNSEGEARINNGAYLVNRTEYIACFCYLGEICTRILGHKIPANTFLVESGVAGIDPKDLSATYTAQLLEILLDQADHISSSNVMIEAF
ncbi:hypothetical protein NEOKW01_0299 [Nematocida sp. AWRm80]|nr:hypothetical protein NEOKW01_0299 [Nematocida sp. AWRm80]